MALSLSPAFLLVDKGRGCSVGLPVAGVPTYSTTSFCSGFASPCKQHPRPPSFTRRLSVERSTAGNSTVKCRVNVAEKEASSAEPYSPEAEVIEYHFVVANAKFMLDEEEHFQEVLRERLRNYGEKNKKQDFWLVIEPKFLENFPDMARRVKRPAVALVSTDATWITFMKLRLDRVLKGSYVSDTLAAALVSNHVHLSIEQPEEWTAPYPKYESGWWTPFLPPQDSP